MKDTGSTSAPGILILGAVGSWVVHRLWAAGSDDPFAGTLSLLPLVVAGLWAVDLETWRWGGRRASTWRVPPAVPWLEAMALLALVSLAVGREALGLDGLEGALFAAFCLLLVQRVARQVVAMRPLLGQRVPLRPSFLFFLLPLVVYLALAPWSTHHRPPDGDEPYYLLITHSLAYDLDADLTNNYAEGDWRGWLERPLEPQAGDPVGPEGQLFSRHNETLPLLLAPAYRVGGLAGALAVMAALAAALAWMVLRLAHRYWPERPGEALVAWALVAFTPPLLLYASQVWVEVPAALLAMVALDRIRSFRDRPRNGGVPWLVVGLALLLLPLVKIRFMLLAVPLLALAWWHAGRPRKPLIVLSILLVMVGGGILVHNELVFDNPLKIHQAEELELTDYPPTAYALGALGLFWDAGFGLFACAPLWLLLLPGALLAAARERGRPPLFDLAVLTLPYLLVVVPRSEWYGGWSPPFRYALVALPLLALLLVPLLAERRRPGARGLTAALAFATLALGLLWVTVPGWTYDFADGRTYLLDHLTARLGADVARFFPSMVRPRAATWIWPPATLLLVTALWWWPRRRVPPHRAAAWGTVALLAAAALLPWAAERKPTRRVEFEDPYVQTDGGRLFPRRWIIERTRYRGGWVLPEGAALEAPVVAGGDLLSLRLDVKLVDNVPGRPVKLALYSGDRLVHTWTTPTHGEWSVAELGPLPWTAGEPLRVRVLRTHNGRPNGVILDGADLTWRSSADPP